MAKKGDLVDLTNVTFHSENQKQIAIIVQNILRESGLSQREFADVMQVSLATFTNILRPYKKQLPSRNVLRAVSLMSKQPKDTYNTLMRIAGYDTLKYPFHYVVDKAKTINTYRIKSHKGNIAYTTIVCDYQPKGILVQQLITGGYIIDNIECIDMPCFIEHRENS